jgi:enoyl-CoA hydratase/carnithine racemase
MPTSHAEWTVDGSTAVITFNRPEARNALTWEMYEALVSACDRADTDPAVRVLIIRGNGGAFAAGTDISQFRDFKTGDDGVFYEKRLDAVIDRIERVMKPTIAEVDGAAVGGGCAIAIACDFRICSDRARFGVPVARTLGNCLSITNTARLADIVGAARVKDLMLTGRLVDANEALAIGLATRVVPPDRVGAEARTLAAALAEHAPSTIIATKKMMLRLRDHRRPAADSAEDIIRECYGSKNFREGVAAFLEGRPPRW